MPDFIFIFGKGTENQQLVGPIQIATMQKRNEVKPKLQRVMNSVWERCWYTQTISNGCQDFGYWQFFRLLNVSVSAKSCHSKVTHYHTTETQHYLKTMKLHADSFLCDVLWSIGQLVIHLTNMKWQTPISIHTFKFEYN